MVLLESDERSMRSAIINILSSKHPLSAKEIHEIIRSDIKNATYPAVYKTLKVLGKEGKLVKKNRLFSLNIEWVKNLKSFAEDVESSYVDESIPPSSLDKFSDEDKSYVFYFNNLADADNHYRTLKMQYVLSNPKNPYFVMRSHIKSHMIVPDRSLKFLNTSKENKMKSYIVVSSDTALDRWGLKFHKQFPNVFIKLGVKIPSINDCETRIFGDIVMQTYIPEKIKNFIDNMYKKTKNVNDLDIHEFYEKAYTTPCKIKLVVIKNKAIADHLRSQIMSYFDK